LSTIGLLCSILGFSLLVFTNSYAPEKQYENEKVTGTFVTFQPEGYNEKTGKTRADKHYMYVVYDVKGQLVILNAKAGVDYPKNAVLYKN
jgi:hypothetical protein